MLTKKINRREKFKIVAALWVDMLFKKMSIFQLGNLIFVFWNVLKLISDIWYTIYIKYIKSKRIIKINHTFVNILNYILREI